MKADIDSDIQQKARDLARQITVAHDLVPEIQEELYGHIEDKLLAYKSGEERISDEDAFILVRERVWVRRKGAWTVLSEARRTLAWQRTSSMWVHLTLRSYHRGNFRTPNTSQSLSVLARALPRTGLSKPLCAANLCFPLQREALDARINENKLTRAAS